MLFSDKYPKADKWGSYEHGNYTYKELSDNCYVCGQMTHFVETNSGAYICSDECDEKFYDEIFKQAMK